MLNPGTHRRLLPVFAPLLLLTFAGGMAHGQLYRPDRDLRSVNTDRYNVAVQRNGRVNIRDVDGGSIFADAHPLVWLDGADRPQPLPLDGHRTGRVAVHDALGEGQGMLFRHRSGEWLIHTYPTQPYLVVQAGYTNTGKKPVRIRALAPWGVAGTSKGARVPLPPEPAPETAFFAFLDAPRYVVAGFLSEQRAQGVIATGTGGALAAWCIYDPPIEVQPGQTVTSERLYLSVAETDAADAPQRYGHAIALAHGVVASRAAPRHGWQIGSLESPPDHLRTLAAIEALRDLHPFGWRDVTIGPGWRAPGSQWTPDPARFPEGFGPLTRRARELGFRMHLWADPFVVPEEDPLAGEHREWLLEVPTDSGGALLVMDVTRTEVQEHVRDAARRVVEDWGFDGLLCPRAPHPLLQIDPPRDQPLTRIGMLRIGLQALRDGLGPDAFLATAAPFPAAAGLAQGHVQGTPEGLPPLWFMQPWVFTSIAEPLRADMDTADIQVRLFARALTGGSVLLTGDPAIVPADTQRLLRVMLPPAHYAFRPVSETVLAFRHAPPRSGIVAAVLPGPGAAPLLDLTRLGAAPGYHLVYAPATGAYLGRAAGMLSLPVSPGVQVVGLQPATAHPSVLGCNRGMTGGYPALVEGEWNAAQRLLAGTVEAVAGFACRIDCFAPEGHAPAEAEADGTVATVTHEGALVTVSFVPERTGRIPWRVRF